MKASPGTTRDENGFPIHCRPDRLCDDCLHAAIAERRRRRNTYRDQIARAHRVAKAPWQPPARPSSRRWQRGRGPGSYA